MEFGLGDGVPTPSGGVDLSGAPSADCRAPSADRRRPRRISNWGGRVQSISSVENLALSMGRLVVTVPQQLAMGADVASWVAEG